MYAQLTDKKLLATFHDANMDLGFLCDRRDACAPGSAGRKHYEVEVAKKMKEVSDLTEELKSRGLWH